MTSTQGESWTKKALALVGGLVVAALIAGYFFLDFIAYRQRFPNASAWTYFFSQGR